MAIEQLFRTRKDAKGHIGFDVEALRIGEDAPRTKLVMAALVAAVTVQQLVHARDGSTGRSSLRPVTDAFDPDDLPLIEAFCKSLEGKTERQKNPHPKGSLAYAASSLRPPRRMDRLLRQARSHRHAPRLARLPSRQTRRHPPRGPTRCVNPLGPNGRGPRNHGDEKSVAFRPSPC